MGQDVSRSFVFPIEQERHKSTASTLEGLRLFAADDGDISFYPHEGATPSTHATHLSPTMGVSEASASPQFQAGGPGMNVSPLFQAAG